MRLIYKILWIENEQDWQSSNQDLIEEEVSDLGFILEIEVYKDYGKLDDLTKEFPHLKKYDLILVDYKLDNNLTGDRFIQSIRSNDIYTDVLFYSQDIEALRELFMKLSLEGVYLSNREDFEEKFLSVFHKSIKKFEELNAVRGLVMAETSRLDRIVEDILIIFFNSNSENREELKKIILKKIKDSLKSNFRGDDLKIYEKSYLEIVKSRIFDASKKARAIDELMKIEFNDSNFRFHEDYTKDVIGIRNDLAHFEAVIKDGVEYLMIEKNDGTERIEINSEKVVEIRKNIQKYDKILIDLLSRISKI